MIGQNRGRRTETETETKTLLAMGHNYGVEFKCVHMKEAFRQSRHICLLLQEHEKTRRRYPVCEMKCLYKGAISQWDEYCQQSKVSFKVGDGSLYLNNNWRADIYLVKITL